MAPSLRSINQNYILIAACLGKNRIQRFLSIKLPLIMSTLLNTFAIGMIISLSLYTPVYFIGAGRITTITTETVNLAISG